MPETILVTTSLQVSFDIKRDVPGLYYGCVREYPGLISQGRTREVVRKRLIRLLRDVSRNHPEELRLFQ